MVYHFSFGYSLSLTMLRQEIEKLIGDYTLIRLFELNSYQQGRSMHLD
jgi:hypothetical protein